MKRLQDKIALITGSDSGIGQATAIEFASQGANVVITYHTDEEGAQKTLSMVNEAGGEGIVLKVNVSEEKDVERMFNTALKRFWHLGYIDEQCCYKRPGNKSGRS